MKHFQSVTRLHVGRYIVTVWRGEMHFNALAEPERRDLEVCAEQVRHDISLKPQPPHFIAVMFADVPRVESVEVVDVAGNGVRIQNK